MTTSQARRLCADDDADDADSAAIIYRRAVGAPVAVSSVLHARQKAYR